MSTTDIRAAGGLVWRPATTGEIEVAVVHRNRYDDWSLPKGKLEGREVPMRAAVREVGEETGRIVAVGRRLRTVRYDVGDRAKAVQYWGMRDAGPRKPDGSIVDVDEVDRIAWVPLGEIDDRLTYSDDREVVASFVQTPATTSVVVLVRHARAGKRAAWPANDDLRPLDPRGAVQARALADLLGCFAPGVVYAADRVRCEQTVGPLAEQLDLRVTSMPAVSDEAWISDPSATVAAVAAAAAAAIGAVVICSQGTAIPGLLDTWVPPEVRATMHGTVTRKAAYWAIGTDHGVPTWIDRYDRPLLPLPSDPA